MRRKKLLWRSALGVVVLGAGLALLLLPKSGGVKLNPNRTFSALAVPSTRLWYPSISKDGNWVVFPAADENDMWDLYWMYLGGGEATKITREGWASIDYVDLSPDAGQVVFQGRKDPGSPRLIRMVPLQGGAIRTVCDTGAYARWRPDGKRIGYLRFGVYSASGKFEVWSVKADGSDNHIEFIDTLNSFDQRVTFSWSPDGSSIAWVRNFSPSFGEVMVRELAAGKERQLTNDRAQVDEIVWPTSDRIVFISNKSGHSNLWAISADGGQAIQVTEGAVPIYGAKMSADLKKLVYLQQEQFSHIWISALDGSSARQLTFDDVRINWAGFSPNGKQIACALGSVDIYRPEIHLYVMDSGGKNRRALTSGPEVVVFGLWSPDGRWLAYLSRSVAEPADSGKVYLVQPSDPAAPKLVCTNGADAEMKWSPDGRWLAYNSRSAGESKDSSRVYLIQPSNPGAPRFLADGVPSRWIDSVNLLVERRDTTFWRYSIGGGVPKRIPKDLTFLAFSAKVWKILNGTWDGAASSPDEKTLFYQLRGGNEIWRLRASGGKEERIGTLPSKTFHIIGVSSSGKDLLLLQIDIRSKLALIENLFE